MLWRVLPPVLGAGLGAVTRSNPTGGSGVDEAEAGVWFGRLA
jgi:hypothetical protein